MASQHLRDCSVINDVSKSITAQEQNIIVGKINSIKGGPYIRREIVSSGLSKHVATTGPFRSVLAWNVVGRNLAKFVIAEQIDPAVPHIEPTNLMVQQH